jgi:hypothetical protein
VPWKDVLIAFMGDSTPEEKARLLRIAFRIVVIIHILWVCGLLVPFGFQGAVFAQDVDKQVQAALEPIRSEIGNVAKKQEALSDENRQIKAMVERVLIGNLAAQLRDLNRLRCTTSDHVVRMRMENDIEAGHQEYKRLTGERYPLAACKDL